VHIQIQEREKLEADPTQIQPPLRAQHAGKRQLGNVNLKTQATGFTFAQPDACKWEIGAGVACVTFATRLSRS
jgi:hypothetical protein